MLYRDSYYSVVVVRFVFCTLVVTCQLDFLDKYMNMNEYGLTSCDKRPLRQWRWKSAIEV